MQKLARRLIIIIIIWEQKQPYRHFKWQITEISYEKSWIWLRNGNFRRETEPLLIAAQNNTIRANYVKQQQQLYGYQPSISQTIWIRRTRHAGNCWRRHVFLWMSLHGRAGVGRPARTYQQQLRVDTGCSLEDLPEAMDDGDEWWKWEWEWKRERERESRRNPCSWHKMK